MNGLCVSLALLAVAVATAEQPRTWLDPKIESIHTLEGGSLLDLVNQILVRIKKDKDSAISVHIDASDEELDKQHVTLLELRVMRIIEGDDGEISVPQGPKWPRETWGKMSRFGNTIVLRAYRHEIKTFNALLRLHQLGFQIPIMNNQNSADQSTCHSRPKASGRRSSETRTRGALPIAGRRAQT